LYLICLIGCVGFYIAYREWMAGLFLVAMLLLPWFCLLVSLPAMLMLQLEAFPDLSIRKGEQTPLYLKMRSPFPAPSLAWKFRISSAYGGKVKTMKRENMFQAAHCGCYTVSIRRGRKYDYLGLFCLPFGKKIEQKIYVFPRKEQVQNVPDLQHSFKPIWKPKPEAFSENYDLRLYRSGDSLRQIHWKLSSKTGKYILREPIVAQRGLMVLSMVLNGTPDELDRKLGRTLYLSDMLLSKELTHELHCLSAEGVRIFKISSKEELLRAIQQLLCMQLSDKNDMPTVHAAWHYHIGGEILEA